MILSSADTPAMLDLVAETTGPFGRLTPSMADMSASVRMGPRRHGWRALAGYRASSSARSAFAQARSGASRCLTRHLMRLTFEGGEVPFLHVRPDNAAAVALYRRLGFATRRELVVCGGDPNESGTSPSGWPAVRTASSWRCSGWLLRSGRIS